mmetsp:Transcript_20831/g.61631  ORF Transcript_20831/g.61631 Transcript_20831/m.61631 type:complete len:130 (-) Transcript_20831:252-641(-)
MEALEAFAQTVALHRDRVDFCFVYVQEAHPTDGWDVGSKYRLAAHTSLNDRLQAAQMLVKDASAAGVAELPLLVDGMDDSLSELFGAAPERLAIIRHGRLLWLGGRGPMFYSVAELNKALTGVLKGEDP